MDYWAEAYEDLEKYNQEMEKQSVKKNYIYNLVYQCITFLIPIITTSYVSRIFGPDGVGIQSYTNSIVSYFVLFSALGTSVYGAREIARLREDRTKMFCAFCEIEALRCVSTGVFLLIWLFFILFSKEFQLIYCILTIQILATAFDITWFYEGIELFRVIVVRNTIIKIFQVAFLFVFIKRKEQLWIYILSMCVFALLGNLSLWFGLKKYKCEIVFSINNVKKHIKDVWVYFVPTIATSVYTVLDKSMIGIITKIENENGYYEQAEKIISLGKAFVGTMPAVATTRISYLFVCENKKEIASKIYDLLEFTLVLSLPLTFGIVGISKTLVPWYLGKGFEKVVVLLWITSPLIVIVGLSSCLARSYLTPSGQRARSIKAILSGAVLNFTLNLILIPKCLSLGAAISSVAAELLITIMYIYMSKEYISFSMMWKISWKKIVASSMMLLCVMSKFTSRMFIAWKTTLFQIIVGGAVYIIALVILRDNSLRVLRRYIKK